MILPGVKPRIPPLHRHCEGTAISSDENGLFRRLRLQ